MRRLFVLGAIVSAGLLSMTLSAYQQPAAAPKVVEVEKLKDNLYMLKGGGGNTAVFVGTDGVTVVDTKNPGWGQPILDKIKTVTDKPVDAHHQHAHARRSRQRQRRVPGDGRHRRAGEHQGEHGGDAAGHRAGGAAAGRRRIFKQNNGRGMPKRTFKDKMTIGKGADQIDLYYFGRGHTNGDAWVVFPALRVMHAGDIFTRATCRSSTRTTAAAASRSPTRSPRRRRLKNVDTIINGHSPTTTTHGRPEDAGRVHRRLRRSSCRTAKKAGKTVDDVANAWKTPARYTGYAAPQAARVKSDAQVIWDDQSRPDYHSPGRGSRNFHSWGVGSMHARSAIASAAAVVTAVLACSTPTFTQGAAPQPPRSGPPAGQGRGGGGVAFGPPTSKTPYDDYTGFTKIFDGKTFTNWIRRDGRVVHSGRHAPRRHDQDAGAASHSLRRARRGDA